VICQPRELFEHLVADGDRVLVETVGAERQMCQVTCQRQVGCARVVRQTASLAGALIETLREEGERYRQSGRPRREGGDTQAFPTACSNIGRQLQAANCCGRRWSETAPARQLQVKGCRWPAAQPDGRVPGREAFARPVCDFIRIGPMEPKLLILD